MIKEIIKGIILGTVLSLVFAPIIVHAETPQERWIRIQKESNEEFMKGVEEDGNLTEEAYDQLSWGGTIKGKINKKKEKKSTDKTYTIKGDEVNKGYVYTTDELHVVGLPEDERGYTKAGDYGKIEVDK